MGIRRPRNLTDEQLIDYIRSKCSISKEGCWVWHGTILQSGYGQIKRNNKVYYTHRLVWEVVNKATPDTIDHICRNRCCCNPDHLENVPNAENVKRAWHRVLKENTQMKTFLLLHGYELESILK